MSFQTCITSVEHKTWYLERCISVVVVFCKWIFIFERTIPLSSSDKHWSSSDGSHSSCTARRAPNNETMGSTVQSLFPQATLDCYCHLMLHADFLWLQKSHLMNLCEWMRVKWVFCSITHFMRPDSSSHARSLFCTVCHIPLDLSNICNFAEVNILFIQCHVYDKVQT